MQNYSNMDSSFSFGKNMDKNQAEIVWRKCLFPSNIDVSYMAEVMKLVKKHNNLTNSPPLEATQIIKRTREWYNALIGIIPKSRLMAMYLLFLRVCYDKEADINPCKIGLMYIELIEQGVRFTK